MIARCGVTAERQHVGLVILQHKSASIIKEVYMNFVPCCWFICVTHCLHCMLMIARCGVTAEGMLTAGL
jgi:hypothetical protein